MRAKPILLSITILGASLFGVQNSPASSVPSNPSKQASHPAFLRVWERTDSLVLNGKVQRTWLWGPEPLATQREPLAERPDGMREVQYEVQYYDKSRMEINNPSANRSSPWYVTNGLLVYEMVSGKVQVGMDKYEARAPARISVAGDTITDTSKLPQSSLKPPSYETLRHVATLAPGQNQQTPRPGVEISQVLEHTGQVRELKDEEKLSLRRTGLPKLAHHVPVTGHNIPDVFWNFMNRTGIVYEDGKEHEGKLVDWIYAMGYPITEPYWARIRTGDGATLVLMQAFQRRVLTYNPKNTQEWQVEMGNVGSHYYLWRYGSSPNTEGAGTKLPMRDVWRDEFEIGAPTYEIIKSENAWVAFWLRVKARPRADPLNAPTVDFNTELLIAVAWGPKSTSHYKIDIKSIKATGRTLTINVERRVLTGAVLMVVTHPSHFVAIPRGTFDGGNYTVLFLDTEGVILTSKELTLP
jgi:hypothetical protein